MSDLLQLRADIRKLASQLQSAAYRHGEIDSSDRWSDKKYRDACDRSNAALTALLNRIDDALNLRPQAAQDVLAERRRQIEVEGWTAKHDDQHRSGELAVAAACYAISGGDEPLPMWPWDPSWWKPASDRRNLVKAAALLLAEIERLDRAAAQESKP